jgi:hypothetical protein
MPTTTQILDTLYPFTKEDKNCMMMWSKKNKKRADLLKLLFAFEQGEIVQLPDEVLKLMNEDILTA